METAQNSVVEERMMLVVLITMLVMKEMEIAIHISNAKEIWCVAMTIAPSLIILMTVALNLNYLFSSISGKTLISLFSYLNPKILIPSFYSGMKPEGMITIVYGSILPPFSLYRKIMCE
jgi:hypothetical protein